jgi:hypothetical protein
MNTDIRMMVGGLRPVADFRSNVERTIELLNTRLGDMIPVDAEDQQEMDEMAELIHYWESILEGMGE